MFLSALTVVLSLAAVFLVPVMVFRSMALGMILSVVATAAASLTLLPAILVPLGDRVLVARGARTPTGPPRAAGPAGRPAPAPPGATLAAGLGLLLLLAAPAVGMRLGMPGARVVDTGQQSRDGYDIVVDSFGPGAAAPAVRHGPLRRRRRRRRAGRRRPRVARPRRRRAGRDRTVVVRVIPTTAVDDQATSHLVGRLRSRSHDGARRAWSAPGAQNHDLTAALTGTAPYAIGAIMVVAFVLLLVVFRSPSSRRRRSCSTSSASPPASASPRWSSSTATGASLLGIEHQGFVDAWAPLFFFALLFGLSMDYQLFLLAAIKERTTPPATPRRPSARASPAPAGRSPTPPSS